MVCIEEVCSWFRDLYPPKRLDLLCSLLQMCLPLELRFVGSYVEDLAKKDYYYLREAENRANDIQEVKKLTDIFDKETRGKISTYLALIHSSNTVCSNTLYSALTCILLPALDRTRLSQVDEHFVTEVILSLTMAAYHPSFSFNQRHRLLCELHNVKKLFEDHPSRNHSSPTMDCGSSTSSSSTSSTSSNRHRHPDPSTPPAPCSPPRAYSPTIHQVNNASSSPSLSTTAPTTPNNGTTSLNSTTSPVYVQNVEVKGCQMRPDRRNEFVIQVTWSDGHVTETCRTYQQLQQFHAELLKLFPKDAGAHKQERQIPFLPQDKGPSHNHSELEAHIKKYIRQLSVLQDHIVQCHHVTAFFRSSGPAAPAAPSASGPPPAGVLMPVTTSIPTATPVTSLPVAPVTLTSVAMATPVTSTALSTSVTTSPLTIKVESSTLGGSHSPRMLPTFSSSPMSPYSCAPYPVLQGSPSSSGSSPLVSPSSSGGYSAMISPRKDIAGWLKCIRLHKYTAKLNQFTFEELAALSDHQLDQEGLTVGARKKFFTEMTKWRTVPNGLVYEPGSPYHSPPHSYARSPSLDPSAGSPHHSGGLDPLMGSPHHSGGNLSGVDSSSVGSECSSPPTSPGPERDARRDSVSSEDIDKDPVTLDLTDGPDGSEGLLPTPHMMPLQLASVSSDTLPHGLRANIGSVLGLPPGVREGPPASSVAYIALPHHHHHHHHQVDMKTLPEGMPPAQYPPGVRPLIPGLFDSCCPSRPHVVRTVRMPHGAPPGINKLKTMPLLPNHTAGTTPVLPSPKLSAGGSLVFENGHHQLGTANQSFTYVPNPTHGPTLTHGHPPPLGAVPLSHPPKLNGQYVEGSPTPPSTNSPASSEGTPSKVPVGFMSPSMNNSTSTLPTPLSSGLSAGSGSMVGGVTSLAWPTTMANTSLTYSLTQVPPVLSASVDGSGKPASVSPQPPAGPVPPAGSQDFPAYVGMHPHQVLPSSLPSSSSNSSTSSPANLLRQQLPNSTTPPAPTATASPGHPSLPHPATAPGSSSGSCSSCGCHGNCNPNTSAPSNSTSAPATPTAPPMGPATNLLPPPHPQQAYMFYMQQMWQNSHLPYIQQTNGFLNHNLAFPGLSHPVNGLSDVLYHPPNFWLGPGIGGNSGPYGGYPTHLTAPGQTNGTVSGGGMGKKPMCYNCGQSGHWATDCKEPTMDAMSHSGTFHLKFQPKPQDAE